jgi:hypothetical protein
VLVALLCEGQEALSPDLASLVKIKGKVAQNLKQLPNFTCTETIERWVKRTTDHKPEMLGRSSRGRLRRRGGVIRTAESRQDRPT